MKQHNTRRGFTQFSLRPLREKVGVARMRGFTLMEILIVILIIAILAAVAVPQYQKAVMKSRYSALMPIAKSLANGNEAYYMEQGQYATSPTELDIAGQDEKYPDGTEVDMSSGEYSYVLAKRDNLPLNYLVYQKHSDKFADNIHCEADENNTMAQEICQSLGGQEIAGSQTEGYMTYVLSGLVGANDKLPTSISKLKAQICGTQFDAEHCTVDEENHTITTKQCGMVIRYHNGPGYIYTAPEGGCVNTIYDENGQPVREEANLCYTGQYNATDESCVPTREGVYEHIYRDGTQIGKGTCHNYATTSGYEGCYEASKEIKDGEGVNRHVKCSSGVINTATLACPEGATASWEEYTSNNNKTTKYRKCKTVDATTGECTEYSSVASSSFPSYNVTYGPNYGVNGNQDYTKTACSQWTGTTCTGTWEIYEKQEGNNKLTCSGSYSNGRCGLWAVNKQRCQLGVDWDSLTCK